MIGVPARASILAALMDGRALTATELSLQAGVSASTTSSHLAKLVDAGLLACEKHGRHRYYRLASPAIADAMEPLSTLVAHKPVPERRKSRAPQDLRPARMCYDHLAGGLGVALAQAMTAEGYLEPVERDFHVTVAGQRFLAELEIDVAAVAKQRRVFARQCLDWSERKPHLGGSLGAAVATVCLERKWIARPEGRRVTVTSLGRTAFRDLLGLNSL